METNSVFLEMINEKFYDVLNKSMTIEDKYPEISDIFKDITELLTLIMERQNSANEHFNSNFMGIAGDLGVLHKEINDKNSTCCSETKNTKQSPKVTDEIKDIADFIMSDNKDYTTYINNKRNETKEFIKSNSNESIDDSKLTDDIATLSSFIEKKLG